MVFSVKSTHDYLLCSVSCAVQFALTLKIIFVGIARGSCHFEKDKASIWPLSLELHV